MLVIGHRAREVREMKKAVLMIMALAAVVCDAETRKAAVFVDKFETNGDCAIDAAGIQVLHDRIVGNVVSSRKYEVVERENLAKVQQELKLVDAGLTNGNGPESNMMKAAGYCVYGKVIQYRSNKYAVDAGDLKIYRADGIVELQLRIVNITTGQLLAAKTVRCKVVDSISNGVATTKDVAQEALSKAVEQAAKDVVCKLNDVAFPVYVLSVNSRFVTANVAAEQVTEGEVWEVYELGDELTDPQTGESMGRDEELVAKVRVSRPGAKTTKFEPMSETDMTAIRAVWEDAKAEAEAKNVKSVMALVLHRQPEKDGKPDRPSPKLPDFSKW